MAGHPASFCKGRSDCGVGALSFDELHPGQRRSIFRHTPLRRWFRAGLRFYLQPKESRLDSGWKGYVSEGTVNEVDQILDRLNEDSIARRMRRLLWRLAIPSMKR